MDSVNLTAAATAIAFSICRSVPKDQLLLMGSLITQIGETITRVSLQSDLIDAACNPKTNTTQDIAADFLASELTPDSFLDRY